MLNNIPTTHLQKSIIDTATQARIEPTSVSEFEEVHGRGVIAHTSDADVYAGRGAWLLELNGDIASQMKTVEEKIEGMSSVHIMRGTQYLGCCWS